MKEKSGRFYLQKEEMANLPEKSGVYFLYQKGGILVYIGMALSFRDRIPQHDGDKEFAYIAYEPCHISRARQLEKELLKLYQKEHGQTPYYNKVS